MTPKFASKLSLIFVTTFILGIIGFLAVFHIGDSETESTAHFVIYCISVGMILISMILFVIVWLMAIYQSNLPKKFFWVGMIILIVLFPVRIVIQKQRHASYEKRVTACIQSVSPGEDIHICDIIK